MLTRIKHKLKEKDGFSDFIGVALNMIVIIMLMVMAISFLNVYAKHNLVNTMAHEMARYVEIKGEVSSGAYAEFERLKLASGFANANITFSRTGRIPLEESFTITVSVPQKFGIGGISVFPVTIKAVSTGRSEVYFSALN